MFTLIIVHLSAYQHDYSDLCTSVYIPCFFFYSRFHTNYAVVYSAMFIVFAVVSLFLILNKWVTFDILRRRQ